VCLDRAPYFYAKDLWTYVSGEERTESIGETSVERVSNEPLQAWYLPPRLPELNPVEHCWNQVDDWFTYRLIDDLDELKETLQTALSEIDEPNLFKYLLAEDAREQFI